jgi:hypothetical protein
MPSNTACALKFLSQVTSTARADCIHSTGLGLLPLFEISKAACLDVQVPHETDVVLLALAGPTSHCAIISRVKFT